MVAIRGFSPKRIAVREAGGTRVTVTPPMGLGRPKSVLLDTEAKLRGYIKWDGGRGALIQDVLPMLSATEREILINGDPLGDD